MGHSVPCLGFGCRYIKVSCRRRTLLVYLTYILLQWRSTRPQFSYQNLIRPNSLIKTQVQYLRELDERKSCHLFSERIKIVFYYYRN